MDDKIMVRAVLVGIAVASFGPVSAQQAGTREPGDAELVRLYLDWRPTQGNADSPNPYHDGILAKGEEIVPALLAAADNPSQRIAVIWLLGEIGSSKGFPLLLSEYIVRPSTRAGCCVACGYDLRASPDRCPECGRRAAL